MIMIFSFHQLKAFRKTYKNFLTENDIHLAQRKLDNSFARLMGYVCFNTLLGIAKQAPNYNSQESINAPIELLTYHKPDNQTLKEHILECFELELSKQGLHGHSKALFNAFSPNVSYPHFAATLVAEQFQSMIVNEVTNHRVGLICRSYGKWLYEAAQEKHSIISQTELDDVGIQIRIDEDTIFFCNRSCSYIHKQVSGNLWSICINNFDNHVGKEDLLVAINQINQTWEDVAGYGAYTYSDIIFRNSSPIDKEATIEYSATFRGRLVLS